MVAIAAAASKVEEEEEQEEVFNFTAGEGLPRPRQSTDYRERFQRNHDAALVIDNGSCHCRVGWAVEAEPRFNFRNFVAKPRVKSSGQTVNIVGDYDLITTRAFDYSRASVRSPFEGNVVYQFECMETVLDYSFDRLGIYGGSVDHPLLLTECPFNPLFSRSKMAELLFEVYGIPSLALGIDAVFAHNFNRMKNLCGPDGFLVSAGHGATHVIPMVGGEPLLEATVRTTVGGYHSTGFLKQLLSLEYPQHTLNLSWERVEEMKQRHCYVAENYVQELRTYEKDGEISIGKKKIWQLPWTPPSEPEGPTEEELERKAANREKSGQRLKEMAAAKRATKVADLEKEMVRLEEIQSDIEGVSENYGSQVLLEAGFNSRREFEIHMSRTNIALKKAKGEAVEDEVVEEIPDSEKYPLLDIPDTDLTPELLKEKRKQRFVKNAAEGRARLRQKKEEERVKEERERQLEEIRRQANPDAYLDEIRAKFNALHEKREQRKRRKVSGTGGSALASGTGGRGERLTAAQRERMRLLTAAAFDKGKGEDTFGADDADWQLYKQMGREEEEEEDPEEGGEYTRLLMRMQEIDPTFIAPPSTGVPSGGGPLAAGQDPAGKQRPTEKDFRISLGVGRIRAPEIIFQPSIIAVDQAGLGEIFEVVLRRCPPEVRERVARGRILLTGGNCLLPGMDKRVEAEIRKIRPLGSAVNVVRGYDPILDAWHGAAEFARRGGELKVNSFTKAEYEERGSEWLRTYSIMYGGGR